MNDCLAVILGGGRGTRLFPLTRQRSKPAVPIAGKYRLIDIPVSNCLNSNLRRIFVLTQYNSESLNKHLSMTYKFDIFSSAFVTTLAAEQTDESPDWFQGTADAVRQSMWHFRGHRSREVLILSGDQLYQMDFRKMLETHRRHVADATVAVLPVTAERDRRLRHPEGEPAGADRPLRGEAEGGPPARARVRHPGPRPRLPRLDGDLHVLPRGAREGDGRPRARGLRPPRDPERHRRDAGAGPLPPRLLGGRGDDRLVLRGQPAAVRPHAPLRLLRRGAARLHSPALPARDEGRGLLAAGRRSSPRAAS